MIFDIGTILVSRGKHPLVARLTKVLHYLDPPRLESVIEFDGDGSIHDYWPYEELDSMFYKFEYGMIVYCNTGRSSFCIDWEPGFYKTAELNSINSNEWLGKYLPGSTQEEFQRAYKLKAFW